MRRAVAAALLAASTGCGFGFERTTKEDFEAELADSLADSLRAVSDASEAAAAGPSRVGTGPDLCDGDVQVIATDPVCGVQVPSDVLVTWSCLGPAGNGASGTASVQTALTPDACPPAQVTAAQAIAVNRHWVLDRLRADLTGTADVGWTNDVGVAASEKSFVLDLEHVVARKDEVLRHQLLAGTRTVALDKNGPGDADDARVVDGTIGVDFVLADVHADLTETDVTFRRGCCHPVAGTVSYALTGASTRQGSIVFGPACGAAETESGRVLDLAPCIGD